jgi:microcin C transport system substrate-binding protein
MWAEKYRRNIGLSNFDEVREVVVRDRNLEFEMLKKGDLDYYFVQRAQMWAEELNFDKIQSGVLQKRKVWNHNPQSLQGIAFNTRRKPYEDIRVRKALRLMFNRELMIEKLMYNEYQLMDSVFPNGCGGGRGSDSGYSVNLDRPLMLLSSSPYPVSRRSARTTRGRQSTCVQKANAQFDRALR